MRYLLGIAKHGGVAVTQSSESSNQPSDISRLLLKAVKGLPEDEQRLIFEYFFERGIGIPQPPFFGQFLREEGGLLEGVERGAGLEPARLEAVRRLKGAAQTTIPVRLSEAQHRRLKDWSTEHNFPMAVVVRGLIDRFLDSWDKRAGQA